ncbi:unnamed protein product [Pleuronectes platessa]|uniref:Uncharacterized protein n=1 Tax=Pleuronectes platessa TaxID=8262 RepID=A0A9N7YHR5_PLEPL|nr:unnamed protein product [Pleuronectes platessa]
MRQTHNMSTNTTKIIIFSFLPEDSSLALLQPQHVIESLSGLQGLFLLLFMTEGSGCSVKVFEKFSSSSRVFVKMCEKLLTSL